MPVVREVRLVEEAVVDARAADAYDVIAEVSARPGWMTELARVDAPPGPAREGDQFEGEATLLGHRFIGRSEVTASAPGERLEERVVIGARFTSTWEVVDGADGRTVVRHVLAVEFPRGPLGWLGRWVLRSRLRRMQRASLTELAARLSR